MDAGKVDQSRKSEQDSSLQLQSKPDGGICATSGTAVSVRH